MEMKTENILEKLKGMYKSLDIKEFIKSLSLTKKQFEILSDHKNEFVRRGIARHSKLPVDLMYKLVEEGDAFIKVIVSEHPKFPVDLMYKLVEDEEPYVRFVISGFPNLPVDLVIRLRCDSDGLYKTRLYTLYKFKDLNSLKLEDLENAYDLIRVSKYISREYFKKTFDDIISKFPELSKCAKMFKTIILKGKKDMRR